MRLLLIDHGSCDPPTTRVHPLRSRLASEGIDALVCGPASVSNLFGQTPGLHAIHLLDIAAANNVLLKAVRDGSAAAFLTAASAISPGCSDSSGRRPDSRSPRRSTGSIPR